MRCLQRRHAGVAAPMARIHPENGAGSWQAQSRYRRKRPTSDHRSEPAFAAALIDRSLDGRQPSTRTPRTRCTLPNNPRAFNKWPSSRRCSESAQPRGRKERLRVGDSSGGPPAARSTRDRFEPTLAPSSVALALVCDREIRFRLRLENASDASAVARFLTAKYLRDGTSRMPWLPEG